jgi:DNA mismatch repair protein PMS2
MLHLFLNTDLSEQTPVIHVILLSAEPTKRVQLTSIPVSKNWQFGKEDIDELLFMLQVNICI